MKFLNALGEFLRIKLVLSWFAPSPDAYSSKDLEDEVKPQSKLLGFDQEEILSQWVYLKFPFDHIVILTDINVEAKNIQFWAKVPSFERQQFLKDVVVARYKDKSEVEKLVDNIAPEFASAFGYSGGMLFTYNKKEEEYE